MCNCYSNHQCSVAAHRAFCQNVASILYGHCLFAAFNLQHPWASQCTCWYRCWLAQRSLLCISIVFPNRGPTVHSKKKCHANNTTHPWRTLVIPLSPNSPPISFPRAHALLLHKVWGPQATSGYLGSIGVCRDRGCVGHSWANYIVKNLLAIYWAPVSRMSDTCTYCTSTIYNTQVLSHLLISNPKCTVSPSESLAISV